MWLAPAIGSQRDALTVAWALEKHYGFEVTKLMDASRSDIESWPVARSSGACRAIRCAG